MIGPSDIVLIVLLVAGGVALVVVARSILRPVARVWRDRTTPIAAVRPGLTNVVATLRATDEPLASWDGTPAVLVRRAFGIRVSARNRVDKHDTVHTSCEIVGAEALQGPDRCAVDLSTVRVFGERREWEMDPATFEDACPLEWAALGANWNLDGIQRVFIDETWIPDGARCHVSGVAVSTDESTPDRDYRGAHAAVRFVSTATVPLIVATGSALDVRAVVMQRARALFVAAGTCWLLAVMHLAALAWIGNIHAPR